MMPPLAEGFQPLRVPSGSRACLGGQLGVGVVWELGWVGYESAAGGERRYVTKSLVT